MSAESQVIPPRGAVLAPVTALLLSVAVLIMGNGLQSTLLPVRASIEGFGALEIGLMGSAYYLGFVAGCLSGGPLIRRVGHIRAFTALASVASTAILCHAVGVEPWLWTLLRALAGFCFAGLFIVTETWLNEKANNENRGFVMGIYTMIVLSMTVVGQLMFTLADPAKFPLFALVSILISLAAVPVALTSSPQPAPYATEHTRLGLLYRNSPVGVVGVFIVGLTTGAFWAVGPAYAASVDASTRAIGIFMAVGALGGALVQWPLGRFSDLVDRRLVMLGACIVAVLASLGLTVFGAGGGWRMLVLSFVFGAAALPLYAICAAHAFDYAKREDFGETSSGLLLMLGLGSVVGPVAASGVMELSGPGGLFMTTGAMHVVFALFVLWRMTQRGALPEEDRTSFDLVSTAPTLVALEPEPVTEPMPVNPDAAPAPGPEPAEAAAAGSQDPAR